MLILARGVLDIVPITDFPDIRMRCAFPSASSGSVMVNLRENKLVRLYFQLTTTEKICEGGAKAHRSKIKPTAVLESAQRIMGPHMITYRELDWWTAHQIGRRVGIYFPLMTEASLPEMLSIRTVARQAKEAMSACKIEAAPEGCLAVIRPDQYVSHLGPLDDVDALNRYFSDFMVLSATGVPVAQTTDAMVL